jgi:hypothetical protein
MGSKFTIEECRKYAEHLRATGQGINNPGGKVQGFTIRRELKAVSLDVNTNISRKGSKL